MCVMTALMWFCCVSLLPASFFILPFFMSFMFRPVRRDYVVKTDVVSRSLVFFSDFDLLLGFFHLIVFPPILELCLLPIGFVPRFLMCL